MAPYDAFPPTKVQSSGYYGRAKPDGLQAASVREEWESHPPLSRLAVVRPRDYPPGSAPSSLPQGPDSLRSPQYRRALHTSWPYVFGPSRGGIFTTFPRTSRRGSPLRPFPRRPPSAPIPRGYGLRSKEGIPSSPALSAAPARISPGMRLPRLSLTLAATRGVLVRPQHHLGMGLPHLSSSGWTGSSPRRPKDLP
jgi:hypothetical protein